MNVFCQIKRRKVKVPLNRLSLADMYNNKMGRVDVDDQLRNYYRFDHWMLKHCQVRLMQSIVCRDNVVVLGRPVLSAIRSMFYIYRHKLRVQVDFRYQRNLRPNMDL